MVQLDIISDPVCPWCYLGKARLDAAMAERPTHPFTIEWHPYQLDGTIPRDGIARRAYLTNKFGPDGAAEMHERLTEEGRAVGIDFRFDAITRQPNTMDAHRLILWAGIEQAANEVVDALFRAWFTEGRDIGSIDVLADIADSAGMNAALVRRLLATDEDRAQVEGRIRMVQEMGITSVPTYLVNRQTAVPGAQPVELWVKVIDEILAQQL